MGFFDSATLVVFSIVVFITGVVFSKSGSTMKSFFSAGGAVPWWISGLSLYMSFFSVGTFVVWGSIAYTHGLVAVSIQSTMCVAGLLVAFFIAPRWNKTKTLTVAEYITLRLGEKTQRVYTTLFLFISMFTTGAFLYPVARLVEITTGVPLYAVIVVLGGLITVYTTVGGLWAVLVTDVLQFVVLTVAVIIVLPLAFDQVGGVSGFLQNAPSELFAWHTEEYSIGFLIAFGFYNMVYIGGNWAYVQRFTSVSTPSEAKKTGLTFGVLYLFSPLIWMLPPMIYKVMNPELQGLADEGAYLMICREILPKGLLGLMLGAMVFATASSINSTLNIAAGVFTNDWYKKIAPKSTDTHTMKVARWATAVFGCITIGVALLVPAMGGVVEVVLSVAAITGSALFFPPVWSLFSKVQNGTTVLTATLISLIVNAVLKFFGTALFGVVLSRSEEMILGVVCPAVVLVGFEVFLRMKNRPHVSYESYQLQQQNRQKENQKTDTEPGSNTAGVSVIAWGIMSIGMMILLLAVLAHDGRLLVGTMGAAVMLLGAGVLFNKRKKK